MGAHCLRRRQRRRHPAHAVAATALRTQELFPGVDRRVYRRVDALRHGDLARGLDSLSRRARRLRRRPARDGTSHSARHLPQQTDRTESVDFRARHDFRPVRRTYDRRRSRRQSLLAVDIRRQPRSRNRGLRDSAALSARRYPSAARRRGRHRNRSARRRHQLHAVRARSRTARRLVLQSDDRALYLPFACGDGRVRLVGAARRSSRSSTCAF